MTRIILLLLLGAVGLNGCTAGQEDTADPVHTPDLIRAFDLFVRADEMAAKGNRDAAVNAYARARAGFEKLLPNPQGEDRSTLQRHIALCLVGEGRNDTALAYCNEAIASNPMNLVLIETKGDVLRLVAEDITAPPHADRLRLAASSYLKAAEEHRKGRDQAGYFRCLWKHFDVRALFPTEAALALRELQEKRSQARDLGWQEGQSVHRLDELEQELQLRNR